MKRRTWIVGGAVAVLAAVVYAIPSAVESRFNRVLQPPPYAASEQAKKLHADLLIVDLHADSLLWGRDLNKRSRIGHLDFPRMREARVGLQAFTVVTQVPRRSRDAIGSDLIRYLAVADRWPRTTWNNLRERALYQAARLQEMERASNGRFVIIRTAADLQRFRNERKSRPLLAGFLGMEGGQALAGDLNRLDEFYAAGYRMMAPTHFADTELSGAANGRKKGGLTATGREWVQRMEARRMIIDLAHASPATIREVTAIATRPVVVSHTGVKGTCDNNRNLSDEELRVVAKTGGVIGIGYWEAATCGRDAKAVARAIRYAVSVVGAEHVALGSDFDGATAMPFDVTALVQVTEALLRDSFSEREIRMIMGENTVRVLSQTLPQ